MSWKGYKISYKALSPVFSGKGITKGNLTKTRPYITARMFWGAWTAMITRYFIKKDIFTDNESLSKCYKIVGSEVREKIVFTYFYPYINSEETYICPKLSEKNQKKLISSHLRTALRPTAGSSMDDHLWEKEYIVDCINNNEIFWRGYIFLKDSHLLINDNKYNIEDLINNVLFEIWIGGERTSGWGHLKLSEEINPIDSLLWNRYEFKNDKEKITLERKKKCGILGHLKIDNEVIKSYKCFGQLEPVFEKEWSSDKSIRGCTKYLLAPGGKIEGVDKFYLDKDNYWKF